MYNIDYNIIMVQVKLDKPDNWDKRKSTWLLYATKSQAVFKVQKSSYWYIQDYLLILSGK